MEGAASSVSGNVIASSSSCNELPTLNCSERTCAICLELVRNKAFVNSCLHSFCLSCILKWSKQKQECPLCKNQYSTVYFHVTSPQVYKQFPLNHTVKESTCSGMLGYNNSQLGRLRQILEIGYVASNDYDVLPINNGFRNKKDMACTLRKMVYQNNYWASFMIQDERWLSPHVYLKRPEVLVSIFPWLYRELEVLLGCKIHVVPEVFDLMVSLLQLYEIYTPQVINYLKPFMGSQTQHFLHELIHYIYSRLTMPAYDSRVYYTSCDFLMSSVISGAVVTTPIECITLDEGIAQSSSGSNVNKRPHVQVARKRKRNTSFPTINYDDVIALTPGRHCVNRLYALNDMVGDIFPVGKIPYQREEQITPFEMLFIRSVLIFQNKFLRDGAESIHECMDSLNKEKALKKQKKCSFSTTGF